MYSAVCEEHAIAASLSSLFTSYHSIVSSIFLR